MQEAGLPGGVTSQQAPECARGPAVSPDKSAPASRVVQGGMETWDLIGEQLGNSRIPGDEEEGK